MDDAAERVHYQRALLASLPPPPRQLKPASFAAVYLHPDWGTIAATALAILLLSVGIADLPHPIVHLNLDRDGAATTGTILTSTRQRQQAKLFDITYDFLDVAGTRHAGKATIGITEYPSHDCGDKVNVVYWRDDPTVFRIAHDPHLFTLVVFYGGGSLCALRALLSSIRQLRLRRRKLRLLRTGVGILGRIESLQVKQRERQDPWMFLAVTYRADDTRDRSLRYSGPTLDDAPYPLLVERGPIAVIVDPADAADAMIFPFELYDVDPRDAWGPIA